MKTLLLFLLAFILVPLLDFVWIGILMKNFYLTELGSYARMENGVFKPILWAAALVYVALAAGIIVFVLPLAEGNIAKAALLGAVLGACIYGTYDFTNLSILQNWSMKFTLVDVAWGTALCAGNAAIVTWVSEKFN